MCADRNYLGPPQLRLLMKLKKQKILGTVCSEINQYIKATLSWLLACIKHTQIKYAQKTAVTESSHWSLILFFTHRYDIMI